MLRINKINNTSGSRQRATFLGGGGGGRSPEKRLYDVSRGQSRYVTLPLLIYEYDCYFKCDRSRNCLKKIINQLLTFGIDGKPGWSNLYAYGHISHQKGFTGCNLEV